jgi:uncharacterized protein
MLGTLARKLRALGLDTAYYKSGDDGGLLSLAESSGRIILTSDRGLAARAARKGAKAVLVKGRSDGERMRVIAKALRGSKVRFAPGDSFCSVCGNTLQRVSKAEVSGKVPPSVVLRHRLFFKCAACGKIYWRGSHWKRLRAMALILRGG